MLRRKRSVDPCSQSVFALMGSALSADDMFAMGIAGSSSRPTARAGQRGRRGNALGAP